jgi:hypothetical protein
VYPLSSSGSGWSRGAATLSRRLCRGVAPLLAPTVGALVIGLHVLVLGGAWRRRLVSVIGPLEAPPVGPSPARPPARPPGRSGRGAGSSGSGGGGSSVTFAHELRRRLAALRVLSEAIELRNGRDGDVDRLVHLLVRELHDLEELEGVMLGVGRRGTREEVDVLEVAGAAARTVELARRGEVTVRASRRPLRVVADPTMLRQALENLMDNAATCGVGHPVEVVVRVAVARRLAGVEVVVADRGPGLGRAGVSRRAGQGVGLPLVRKFARDSGGWLWCGNRDGGGAVFGLWLPVDGVTLPGRAAGAGGVVGRGGDPAGRNGHSRTANRNGNGHTRNANGTSGANGHGTSANGHSANGTNGHSANGTNGHSGNRNANGTNANGTNANGTNANGTNGHGTNGHGTNGHGTNGMRRA